jgi:D-tyrosyl-tRNA(Tyr) deacylase
MKALIQRVSKAKVEIDDKVSGQIGKGILILLGVGHSDSDKDINYLVDKIINLRIFPNEDKPMDKSIKDINGELLIVSQFTLYGSIKKGRRPDFGEAADPEIAKDLYEKFVEACQGTGLKVETGEFAAMMDVSLTNDGPVTFMLESISI